MSLKQLFYKNTKINFSDTGKGNTLVFLHGFLENHKMWQPYFEEFSKENRVIAIDLLGHGETGCIGNIHTMEDMADAVYAVISELKIEKVTLIGHSMGGYVSLAFAELYPNILNGIALVASSSLADSQEKKIMRDRSIELFKKNQPLFTNISINSLFTNEAHLKYSQKIENIKTEAIKTPLQGIIAALEGMKIRQDREFILHFAPCPITMILGEFDTIMPYNETLDQITDTDTELITLPSGHMPHIETQKSLGLYLSNFIKKQTIMFL